MRDLFSKLLKVFLIVLIVILVSLFVFGFVLIMDWPWWVGFFILLSIIGICIGFLFVRKILLSRREQNFVQEVIDQDEYHLKALKGRERDELKDLHGKWKESVEKLRRSHLRKYGNPLYVLPWYLVIGESGSGKTTAIGSARLSSSFTEVNRTSGISGTRNCDWWFFEQAIILDTAGRWSIPIDEGRDKEEWNKFLNLLSKYRKREPLNGICVTIAADKLLDASSETLEEDGKNIRSRIDELMRALGFKFPIYVLVTKCDLVQGMNEFCDYLPENSLDQPMGLLNHDLSTDVVDFQKRTIESIDERLRSIRLLLLHQHEAGGTEPGILLFPEEFKNIQKGLGSFLKGAFKENPYQEASILRGLYFSSGRQEGTPFSHFLNSLGLIGEKEVLPGTSKGLFLHDFFAKILPKDRGLFAPTRQAKEWSALTRNLGLTSWIVIVLAICGLLSFAFVKNLNTLQSFSNELVKPPAFQGEFLEDLISMDRFKNAILSMEDRNNNWWIPRFGLRESIKVEKEFKKKYCNQIPRLLEPFNDQLASVTTNFDRFNTTDEVFGQYVAHLVRRINLMKLRLADESIEILQTRPKPSYVTLLYESEENANSEVRHKFGDLYLYYLTWRTDDKEIKNEMHVLMQRLRNLLKLKGKNIRWIVAWVDKQESIPYLTLEDFWGGDSHAADNTAITPAFSREGKELIDSFFKEIQSALSEPLFLSDQKIEFEKWYRKICFNKWRDFATVFPQGSKRLKTRNEWQQLVNIMATDEGPYFAFLNKMVKDLDPLREGVFLPSWLQQVYKFKAFKRRANNEIGVVKKGKKLFKAIEKKLGREEEANSSSEFLAVDACKGYQDALAGITQILTSRNQGYQMALQVFSDDPATSKSPFFALSKAITELETNMMRTKQAEDVFWELINGPLDFLWKFARMETACYLQAEWRENVLPEVVGIDEHEVVDFLLANDGPVSKFFEGPAKSFIGWKDRRGYYAKKAQILGGLIPFDPTFLEFMQKAKALQIPKDEYDVVVGAHPTEVNQGVLLGPDKTILLLHCAGDIESLVNENYFKSKVFKWLPETCKDVVIQIDIGRLSLRKRYEGPQAFPRFLMDFPGGKHTFKPHDFPEDQDELKKVGVKYIEVNYVFSGDYQEILDLFKDRPKEIQRSIASCWGQ